MPFRQPMISIRISVIHHYSEGTRIFQSFGTLRSLIPAFKRNRSCGPHDGILFSLLSQRSTYGSFRLAEYRNRDHNGRLHGHLFQKSSCFDPAAVFYDPLQSALCFFCFGRPVFLSARSDPRVFLIVLLHAAFHHLHDDCFGLRLRRIGVFFL